MAAKKVYLGQSCLVDGCEKVAVKQSLCTMHVTRLHRYGDVGPPEPMRVKVEERGPCSVDGCPRKARTRGLCATHYSRFRKTGDPGGADLIRPAKKEPGTQCKVEGCDRDVRCRDLCNAHYLRWLRNGDPGPPFRLRRAPGSGSLRAGYFYTKKGVRRCRVVMEEILGRPLMRHENVHHKNGIRDDDRPENLELWVVHQPAGQRLDDLIAFICQHYPNEVRRALDPR